MRVLSQWYFYGIKYLFELGRSESVQCMVINNTIFDTHFIAPFGTRIGFTVSKFVLEANIMGKVDKRHHGEIIPHVSFFEDTKRNL